MKAYVQLTGSNWSISDITKQIENVQAMQNYRFVAVIGTTTLSRNQNCLIFDQGEMPMGKLRIATIADEDSPAPAAAEVVVCHGWAYVGDKPTALAVYRT